MPMSADCPECQGTGYLLKTDERGVITARRCSCEESGDAEKLLRTARIPRRYAHCDFDRFYPLNKSHERALRLAREWVDLWPAVKHGLLFLGRPGTGKTHLAVSIGRELIARKDARVTFYEQRDLLKTLQGTFDSGAEQRETDVLSGIQRAEVLVLDDLGAGRTTAWTRDVLHDIIAHRYNEEKLILITSNLQIGDEDEPARAPARARQLDGPLNLRDRLGDALISRLYEMCKVVRLEGEDYRTNIGQHSRDYL
jgi:DNA replication protein DnaC